MKKTTWAIIGLSVCVVALSIALVVVITQKKTETIIATEPDHFMYEARNIMRVMYPPRPWQPSSSFSIRSDYTKTKWYYYGYYGMPSRTPELEKKVDFFGERVPGIPHKVYMLKKPYQTKKEKK